MRTCRTCLEEKGLDLFPVGRLKPDGSRYPVGQCKACLKAHRARPEVRSRARLAQRERWGSDEQYRRARRNEHSVARYGISLDEKEAMLAAQGGCAVCGTAVAPRLRGWHIDHDHATGEVRGILCANCNIGIGHFQDDPELLHRAQEYLLAQKNLLIGDSHGGR